MPDFNYDDIINLPYPRNDWNFLIKHPRMPIASRAKIFSPFAALRGHNDEIAKTADRHLDVNREELLEDSRAELNDAIADIANRLEFGESPSVSVEYFAQSAEASDGIGKYMTLDGVVKNLDLNVRTITVEGQKISLDLLRSVHVKE